MASTLLDFLNTPGATSLDELLTEEVRFHSPVADYEGRADVAHLFTLIAGVLEGVRPGRTLSAAGDRATFFSGLAVGRPIEGVLRERHDEQGVVEEATLMLRPLSALQAAVRSMTDALEDSPLPSRL